MAKLKNEYACSLILTNDLLGGKWKLRILWHIINGDNRYSLLARSIPDITSKMLSTQLRELEECGFLERTVYPNEVPLRVEYTLTAQCRQLEPLLEELCQFTRKYAVEHDILIKE